MLKRTKAYEFLKSTNFSLRKPILKEVPVEPAFPFKEYPSATKIKLSLETISSTPNLFEILSKRRSNRDYKKYPISLKEISLLCYAVQGITGRAGPYLLRTAPSAGALYPIETYIAINFSSEISPGIYHLEIKDFSLALLQEGYLGDVLSKLALGQTFVATASVVFIWSAVLRRTISKYGNRGLRYIFMDVAHICQNLLLACEALGLKACPIGAFFDEEINVLLGLNEEENVIYIATVGK
ncbi:SagB/ThcOx family dehydrogenase [Thermodesulfobacterium hydrogeniphilum]|uniref:SagB/ThcOx family dehydrogenase n=1 Tax=Thermodesulfobacterium hydrogeniphilum TaxID=161156 RepID=UPI000571ACE3|nr:SagB/ThcOx family dehydrogenase [Thermodesulfobacterium hydrogeniphilum]